MPHKHTRRRGGDQSSYDLAPSAIAKPLSTYSNASKPKSKQLGTRKRKREVENGYNHDDTPRAFARMMDLQSSNKRQRSGLDDQAGSRSAKRKQKVELLATQTAEESAPAIAPAAKDVPKILPGERLRDYAARVDQALPVGGLARKGKTKVEGVKERQTKTEKRLHKMYASWREEDARRKEKAEEEHELQEEEEEEREVGIGGQSIELPTSRRKAKRRKMIGEQAGSDEDPWAELKTKREQASAARDTQQSRGLKGLHDVVQAPPSFKAVPKEKFKVRNGAKADVLDVPSAAGSLKRREELSDARKEVIERYRAMMGKGSKA